ncbi:Sir2 family NAD-dependent protein deacetylase [Propioniciclava soli]|uniref:Sir2 family NAD-dependent protein deacetylase n=1 Tax=Propioniciclava soli TaxID=2775081 RepID=UPI001E632180
MPSPKPHPTAGQVAGIVDLLAGRRWVALTGAGLSTDSGIPDYRGPDARPTRPIQYGEFIRHADARRRYWARSMQGYRSFGAAPPNPGHTALAALGVPIITQNVDGLHTAAGSTDVVDLHGLIERVACLGCGELTPRRTLQERLEAANPQVTGQIPAGNAELRPDGDADIADPVDFVVVPCLRCGGVLKPDVVFFGENVPRDRVARSYAWVDAAEVLLVAGSSLTVMSGLRFARHAAKAGMPVVIVNHGATRADELAALTVDAGTSETLTAVRAALTAPDAVGA